jgi:signal transduction histidine kinase
MPHLNDASVLIVSDDTEFARAVVGHWQAEPLVPEITIVTSDVWRPGSEPRYDLVIMGLVRSGSLSAILLAVSSLSSTAAVYVAERDENAAALQEEYPQLLVIRQQDHWVQTLLLVSIEALRRVEAVRRAQRAERLALLSQRHATLGRYMLEMRPSINNALTSVLGNADLLLLEPGRASGESREQIHAIHTMALRLNEVMQRFSSLMTEMQAGETESHAETESLSRPLAGRL